MSMLIIAVSIASTIIALSVRANSRFRAEERLPMQRSIFGLVNWTAPRVVALSFTPALAIGVLTLFVIGLMTMRPRPGQEGEVLTALLSLGGCLIGAHILDLWSVGRTLRRRGE